MAPSKGLLSREELRVRVLRGREVKVVLLEKKLPKSLKRREYNVAIQDAMTALSVKKLETSMSLRDASICQDQLMLDFPPMKFQVIQN